MSRREELVVVEVKRLEGLMLDLDKDWSRIRWVAVLLPLAVVFFMIYGVLGASLWVLGVVSLLVTSAYLIGVRRREYQSEIGLLKGSIPRDPPLR